MLGTFFPAALRGHRKQGAGRELAFLKGGEEEEHAVSILLLVSFLRLLMYTPTRNLLRQNSSLQGAAKVSAVSEVASYLCSHLS